MLKNKLQNLVQSFSSLYYKLTQGLSSRYFFSKLVESPKENVIFNITRQLFDKKTYFSIEDKYTPIRKKIFIDKFVKR